MVASLPRPLYKKTDHNRVYQWFNSVITEDTASLDALLAHGLPIDVRHPLRHSTALMEATRRGRIAQVQWLLEQGASPVLLSGRPASTPLHAAILGRQYTIARMLAPHARTGWLDAHQKTPLHSLAMDEQSLQGEDTLQVADLLIHSGCPLDQQDQDGATALHYCAIHNHEPLAHRLLAAGANANVVTPDNQVSPLTIAAMEGNQEVAETLLKFGADPHLTTKDGICAAHLLKKRRRQLPL